jgi:hypothetical protein
MNTTRPKIWTRSGKPVDYRSVRCGDTLRSGTDGDTVLYHEYGTQLRVESDGRYILNVLCGRVAEYAVEVALTPEEVQRYRLDGDSFVHDLGEFIHDAPEKFESRVLRKC